MLNNRKLGRRRSVWGLALIISMVQIVLWSLNCTTTKGQDKVGNAGVGETNATTSLKLQCPPSRTLEINDFTQSFSNFINATLQALDSASKDISGNERPIKFLVNNFDSYPSIKGGFWAEFGVFNGNTLIMAYNGLRNQNSFEGIVAGFDSFEGLPVKWRPSFEAGAFALNDQQFNEVRAKIPSQIELYKGWFQNTIPNFKANHSGVPAAVIHHDGDLFVSTTITLQMLDDRIHPGTHFVFDELIGYPGFKDHEILALYLWMVQRNAVLCAMGHMGEINLGKEDWFDPKTDKNPSLQSAWFQVLSLS